MNEWIKNKVEFIKQKMKSKPYSSGLWIVILLFFIPILISWLYMLGSPNGEPNTAFNASDLITLYGSFLAFLGTICLGSLALWQNQQLNCNNKKLANKVFISDNKTDTTLESLNVHSVINFSPLGNLLSNNITTSIIELERKEIDAHILVASIGLNLIFSSSFANSVTKVKIINDPEYSRILWKSKDISRTNGYEIDNALKSGGSGLDTHAKLFVFDESYYLVSIVDNKIVVSLSLVLSKDRYDDTENWISEIEKGFTTKGNIIYAITNGDFSMRLKICFFNEAMIIQEYLLEYYVNSIKNKKESTINFEIMSSKRHVKNYTL